MRERLAWSVALCLFFGASERVVSGADSVPPEVAIGQRLFFETRFAQAFFAQSHGDVNATAIAGDPILNEIETPGSPLDGVFKGKTMNCRQCHLEDEFEGVRGAGLRIYTDFARRSPIPAREDGKTLTTRNAPTLVGASLTREYFFQHADGEFTTAADLVIGGFTGRNFGWLPSEQAVALKNVVNVIRGDDGLGDLAKSSGGAYAKVFAADKSVPKAFQLPRKYRMNVKTASDAKVLACVGNLVAAYMSSLDFGRDATGAHDASPYDIFLSKNNLPRLPKLNESALDYSRRLISEVNQMGNPVFVTAADGAFTTHTVPFQFGADELAGMKLFFKEAPAGTGGPPRSTGNCVSCHQGPEFTDYVFHNTGVSQAEYDSLFGPGAFEALKIPSLAERSANPSAALPANGLHPNYSGTFRSIPSLDAPGQADLGMWNVFANADYPKSQKVLAKLTRDLFGTLPAADILDKTVATFKTPGLRDLGHSNPHLHSGRAETTRAVVDSYVEAGQLQRAGHLRNGDPRVGGIALSPDEARQVSRFLDALNEDFTE